jgi:ABC-type sugar transport system permease subunit
MSSLDQPSTPFSAGSSTQAVSLQARSDFAKQQRRWGWIFLSPWIIGFAVFTAFPILASLVFSFMDFNLLEPEEMQFVGLENYGQILTDPIVGLSLGNVLKFAAIALPLSVFLPILLATMLNSESLFAKRIFRTLFYMPYMVPIVSAVYIWGGVLNSETGWLNRLLDLININGPNWLNDTGWIYPALNIMGLWGVGNAMLYTLAAMQGVPTELYEAAKVDGAGPFTRFRNITLPMISPVIFYNLVLSVVGLWRYFEAPFILKEGTGDPGGSTMFFNIHLYKTAFLFQDMGYGAALAWLLFALAFGSTLLIFASRRYWVYYAAEE